MEDQKPEPNAEARDVMSSAADDVEKMIAFSDEVRQRWTEICRALRDGDYGEALSAITVVGPVTFKAHLLAHVASAKLVMLQHVDRDLYAYARKLSDRRQFEAWCAEHTADEIRGAISDHDRQCDDPACRDRDALTEQLAMKEAH